MAWSQADVDRVNARRNAAVVARAPKAKYRNVKVVVDNHRFDSKREAQHWIELTLRQKAGEIRALERQVPIDLLAPNVDRSACVVISQYIADFVYIECATGKQRIEDAKGHRTREYLLKRKWLELQDGITIIEV